MNQFIRQIAFHARIVHCGNGKIIGSTSFKIGDKRACFAPHIPDLGVLAGTSPVAQAIIRNVGFRIGIPRQAKIRGSGNSAKGESRKRRHDGKRGTLG